MDTYEERRDALFEMVQTMFDRMEIRRARVVVVEGYHGAMPDMLFGSDEDGVNYLSLSTNAIDFYGRGEALDGYVALATCGLKITELGYLDNIFRGLDMANYDGLESVESYQSVLRTPIIRSSMAQIGIENGLGGMIFAKLIKDLISVNERTKTSRSAIESVGAWPYQKHYSHFTVSVGNCMEPGFSLLGEDGMARKLKKANLLSMTNLGCSQNVLDIYDEISEKLKIPNPNYSLEVAAASRFVISTYVKKVVEKSESPFVN